MRPEIRRRPRGVVYRGRDQGVVPRVLSARRGTRTVSHGAQRCQLALSFDTATLEGRWRRFHSRNPHVGVEFVRRARIVYGEGGRIASKTIIESMRWSWRKRIDQDGEKFKINNSYTALYARWAMGMDESLRGFFETRESKGKEA